MPTICTASTICASVNRLIGAADPVLCRRRRRWPKSTPLRLCLRAAADRKPVLQAGPGAARRSTGRSPPPACRSCRLPRITASARRWACASAPFGYSTDVTELDDAAFAALAGIELWIVDCLRREPHPTHSHLAKTLGWIARVRPRRAVLTHMDQASITRARRRVAARGRARTGRARHRSCPIRDPPGRSRDRAAVESIVQMPIRSISSASASRQGRCSTITGP